MNALPQEKRLFVLFRLEPGCLGPTGIELIEKFCDYANDQIAHLPYAQFKFVPRYDKTLPEWEYTISGKNLDPNKVATYLQAFDQQKTEFEDNLEMQLTEYIESFLNRT